jgi:O-antigen/teichoic acid export membrane protein
MDRKQVIIKNVSIGFIFKFFNMGIVYFTIPFLLKYLGTNNYGVWVTLFSMVNILFFVDLGIGNGLKTRLTEAISLDKIKLAKEYISTAYGIIFLISLVFLILGIIVLNTIDLLSLLNVRELITETEIKGVFYISLLFIVSNFILSLYKTLYYSVQKSAIVEISVFFYQLLVFSLIVYALNNFQSSILNVAYFYGFSNVIVSVVFTLLFFRKRKEIFPSIQSFKKKRVKKLLGLSMEFFIIQLCMIIIFTTDNLIISNLLGPDEVTNYDIVLKLFQVLITFSIILLDPFWALFTDAYKKKDFQWIRTTINSVNKIFILFIIVTALIVFLTKGIISIWIGKDFVVFESLPYFMGAYVLVRVFPVIYMFFLNGIGKIKLQMWLYIFGAIINIPLSIFFIKYMDLGISGVILGTILSILAIAIILPFQAIKILKSIEPN